MNLPRTSHWSNANERWIRIEKRIADWIIVSDLSLDTINIIVDYLIDKMNLSIDSHLKEVKMVGFVIRFQVQL